MNELSTQSFVIQNKTTFEEINDSFNKASASARIGRQNILNYAKMMNDMIDYIDGYLEYKDSGDDKYRNKVDDSTVAFYNRMFTDAATYRMDIALNEFRDINREYLECTKRLQDKLQELEDCVDIEAKRVLHISDRQYRKIAKVFKDDMQIYLWLACGKSIDNKLKVYYGDITTPVMHSVNR